jgi:hypothetical protein
MQRLFSYLVVVAVLGAIGLGVYQAIATNWDNLTFVTSEPSCDKSTDASRWLDRQRDLRGDIEDSARVIRVEYAAYRKGGKIPDWDQVLYHVRKIQVILERDTGKPPCQHVEFAKAMTAWREQVSAATPGVEQSAMSRSAERFLGAWPVLAYAVDSAPDFPISSNRFSTR